MNRRTTMEEKLMEEQRPASASGNMNHKLWYNQVQDFAYMQVVGELTKDHVHRLFSMMEDVFKGKDIHKLVIDVRLSKGLLARKEIRDSFKDRSSGIGLDRVAVLGADPASRMTLKILLSVLGKTNVSRFCMTEREAMAWLKEKE